MFTLLLVAAVALDGPPPVHGSYRESPPPVVRSYCAARPVLDCSNAACSCPRPCPCDACACEPPVSQNAKPAPEPKAASPLSQNAIPAQKPVSVPVKRWFSLTNEPGVEGYGSLLPNGTVAVEQRRQRFGSAPAPVAPPVYAPLMTFPMFGGGGCASGRCGR